MASPRREPLLALIEPLLEQLGYELVDLDFVPGRSRALLRVYIDRLQSGGVEQGVGIEDCERVSRELSALLDVEDPLPTAYTLEVSSPGLDRVLRTPAHFERFVGERVHVELKLPRDGRRRYTGRLEGLHEGIVELSVDGAEVRLPFGEIGRARLAPQWDGRRKTSDE
jgi:ribosome maturation factor RimP